MAHTKEHKEGDRIVGAYRSVADKKRAIRGTQLDADGNPTSEAFDSPRGTQDYTLDSKKDISKRRQKALDKQASKDARRKRRAQRISDRKLMGEEQAQDFMRNRKDRFNTAFGNVLLDLTGNEDQMKRVKDRYYRKEGSGTIQNVAKLDKDGKPTGETYNAMDPFQFARTRTQKTPEALKTTKYTELIQPKPMADLNIDIKEPEKIQEKIVEDKKEKEIIDLTDPSRGTPTLDTSVNITTDTINATTPSLGEESSFMTEESQKERDRRGLAANRGGFFQRLFNIGG